VPFEALDELIRRQIEIDRLPGLAIALVRGDEIVWSRGFGVADVESKTPMTPETVFSVQSVLKRTSSTFAPVPPSMTNAPVSSTYVTSSGSASPSSRSPRSPVGTS